MLGNENTMLLPILQGVNLTKKKRKVAKGKENNCEKLESDKENVGFEAFTHHLDEKLTEVDTSLLGKEFHMPEIPSSRTNCRGSSGEGLPWNLYPPYLYNHNAGGWTIPGRRTLSCSY
jgi:hypothetical protein